MGEISSILDQIDEMKSQVAPEVLDVRPGLETLKSKFA